MSARVFVPRDAGARRRRRRRGRRRRSRARPQSAASTSRSCATARAACYWLEPMVEVETAAGRIAYGPVERRATSTALFDAGFLDGGAHRAAPRPRRGNPVPEAPDAAHLRALRHHRSAVARRLSRAWRHARAWSARSTMAPAAIVEEVTQSGLRGRGGAGFPTGIKWKTVAERAGRRRNTSSATPTRATAAPSPTA